MFNIIKDTVNSNITAFTESEICNTVKTFAEDNIISLYDFNAPSSDPRNLALLILAPIAAVGVLSISQRVASGTLSIGSKVLSGAALATSHLTNAIAEGTHAIGNKLDASVKRNIGTDLKIAALLSAVMLGGVGTSELLKTEFGASISVHLAPIATHLASIPAQFTSALAHLNLIVST